MTQENSTVSLELQNAPLELVQNGGGKQPGGVEGGEEPRHAIHAGVTDQTSNDMHVGGEPYRHDDWMEVFRYFDEEKEVYEYTEGCLIHHQSPFRRYWDAVTMVIPPSLRSAAS